MSWKDIKTIRKIKKRKARVIKQAEEKNEELEVTGSYFDREINTKNLHKCEKVSKEIANVFTMIDGDDEEIFNLAMDFAEAVDELMGIENDPKKAIECFYDASMMLGQLDLATQKNLSDNFEILQVHLKNKI